MNNFSYSNTSKSKSIKNYLQIHFQNIIIFHNLQMLLFNNKDYQYHIYFIFDSYFEINIKKIIYQILSSWQIDFNISLNFYFAYVASLIRFLNYIELNQEKEKKEIELAKN